MQTKEKVAVLLVASTLLLSISALTVVPMVSASSSQNVYRHGTIYLTKTCDPDFPTPPVCTVITSTSGPIPVGTIAVYFGTFSPSLQAIVVINTPDGSTATGHVQLNYTTGLGTVTFAGEGDGDLAGFHAHIAVNCLPGCPGPTTWDGTYFFTSS